MTSDYRRLVFSLLALALMFTLAGCDGFWATSPHPQPLGPNCPAWTAPTKQASVSPPSSTKPAALAQYNAQLLEQTIRPVRNPYTLTQRLVVHKPGHVACAAPSAPPDEQVGAEQTFWVINASQSGYHKIRARLDYVTPHIYDYVQDGATVNYLALKAAADAFDATIYNAERSTFGDQWSIGPNHQPRITLLNARDLGPVGGYFSSGDEYPATINRYSNQRQMIYLNLSTGVTPGSPTYVATLAHEFQHMIHWWERPTDPSWVNEGMSVLAQRLNGFSTQGLERSWLNAPQTPLVSGWSSDAASNQARYGVSYAFMDYLYQRYGGKAFLRDFMRNNAQVPQAFDQTLSRHGAHGGFSAAYSDFLLAALLNDPTIAHGAYSFTDFPGERARLTSSIKTYPYAGAQKALPQYGAAYFDFRPQATNGPAAPTLSISFAGAPTTSIIPNTPYHGAAAEWWSNSGDNMDSTLTRTFDLTNANATPTPAASPTGATKPVPTATATVAPGKVTSKPKPIIMNFAAWYDLEPGFDYTYVEVSTDNGVTWTALPATTSTSANANGANLGYGLTGVSGGGAAPQWTRESVNLTAYAGKKIQVRFETVTDDAVHNAGFALDAISIPAINYTDSVATANGWSADGWMRSDNTVAQSWTVEAVVFHAGSRQPSIEPISVSSAGVATATFPDFGGSTTHVELAVAPTDFGGYVPAPYQLTAATA